MTEENHQSTCVVCTKEYTPPPTDDIQLCFQCATVAMLGNRRQRRTLSALYRKGLKQCSTKQ